MSEFIKRAAKALGKSIESSPHNFGDVGYQRTIEDAVRAVIEVMREPTEAMAEAGANQFMCRREDVYEIWSAMIDAALNE